MKQKEYLIILGSALAIIIFWVIFNIYHNYTTSSLEQSENTAIVPIEGNFDQNTINKIRNRKRSDISLNAVATISATPTPKASPTPIISSSPSSTLSPTISPTTTR